MSDGQISRTVHAGIARKDALDILRAGYGRYMLDHDNDGVLSEAVLLDVRDKAEGATLWAKFGKPPGMPYTVKALISKSKIEIVVDDTQKRYELARKVRELWPNIKDIKVVVENPF